MALNESQSGAFMQCRLVKELQAWLIGERGGQRGRQNSSSWCRRSGDLDSCSWLLVPPFYPVEKQLIVPLSILFHNAAEEELEISPYDDTSLDTQMAPLSAGNSKDISCRRAKIWLNYIWSVHLNHDSSVLHFYHLWLKKWSKAQKLFLIDTHLCSSASSLVQLDGENQCLKAAQDCGLFEKCGSLRSEYVLACTKKVPGTNRCNQQKCHRTLRRFLERVPEEYSLPVLFCPCTSTLCGERRRKNIVPSCSYEQIEGLRHNCLQQQSICRQDELCRWNWHFVYLFDWIVVEMVLWRKGRKNDAWCTEEVKMDVTNENFMISNVRSKKVKSKSHQEQCCKVFCVTGN